VVFFIRSRSSFLESSPVTAPVCDRLASGEINQYAQLSVFLTSPVKVESQLIEALKSASKEGS
jgi:hypothetical protein